MTNSDKIQFKINSTKHFLEGQLKLYKMEFIETENNKYLEVMNEMNEALRVVRYLESFSKKLMKDYNQLKNKI
jgi:hypothetical protein